MAVRNARDVLLRLCKKILVGKSSPEFLESSNVSPAAGRSLNCRDILLACRRVQPPFPLSTSPQNPMTRHRVSLVINLVGKRRLI